MNSSDMAIVCVFKRELDHINLIKDGKSNSYNELPFEVVGMYLSERIKELESEL